MRKQENSTQEYKYIQTVGEYINAIQEIIKKEREKDSDFDKNYEVYFRGHIDKDFFLIPSLLRNKPGDKDSVGQACKEIVDNEHIAFRSIVAKHPSEFAECTSAIEYLVKMQHYKLKTRLLDITSNALVALYFACTTESGDVNDKLGEVIVFKLPKRIIKHYDSDTISAVANIARCKPSDFIFSLRGEKNQLSDFINGLIDPGCKRNKPTYNNYQSALLSKSNGSNSTQKQGMSPYNSNKISETDSFARPHLHGIPQTEIQNLTNFYRAKIQEVDTSEETFVSDEYKAWFNDKLCYLHHQIKAEKSYYNLLIEPYDLGKIWAVNTKLENPRIINQSGSFLLFGLGINEEEIDGSNQLTYTKEFHPQIPDSWIAGRIGIGSYKAHTQEETEETKNQKRKRKKKNKKKKANIVRQLSMLGIDHSFIFPDLETAAKEINKQLLS
jgi:FRG domain protein